ncbi:MAG: DUF6231 family protein [Salinisphaera sp.]|uniref:DUF6231 family protein n=1 Tax=Salinisphaera sp. TaxID=1914330 RepID=UPI003C7B7D17
MPDDIQHCLRDQITQHDAKRCLLIAPPESLIDWGEPGIACLSLDEHFDAHQSLTVQTERAELAIVIDAPRALGRPATRELLGRLRNYAASAIVAAFPMARAGQADEWSQSDFLGLGFRRLRPNNAIESAYWLYRYDIFDYKITPEWLNSRHWANPSQWDKQRW